MSQLIEIRPQPTQEIFLSSPADICILGGGAGGGKSFAILVDPLRHVENKDFGGVIFRRTSPQITNEGGLWDESAKLYPALGGEIKTTGRDWRFPSGSSMSFAHLQHEKNVYDWQGSQIPFIGFDELAHFTEKQFFYMLSRNRSTCGVRPYIRATCNPAPDTWLAKLLDWWIDEKGYPIKERAGAIRYFCRVEGVLHWADTKAELAEKFPQLASKNPNHFCKSLSFVPSTIFDNPILMQKDEGYLANLLALPLVEREQLLDGCWKARLTAGKFFNRGWFKIFSGEPTGGELCRFWDFAATEKKLAGDDPDYSASVLMRRVKDGDFFRYIIEDSFQIQAAPADVERIFHQTKELDVARARASRASYRLRWEIEPGSAAIRENHRLIAACAPLDAKGVHSREDKLTRARGFAIQAEHGFVSIMPRPWADDLLAHLHAQPDAAHDDLLDACSGSFNELSGKRSLKAY